MAHDTPAASRLRLLRAVDPDDDHVRGQVTADAVVVVAYEDFLCPYCRRLREVYDRLREALGDRLVYVARHFPNERAHPGAELAARASEAAARQGRFFEMHDLLYDHAPSLDEEEVVWMAGALGLDVELFRQDLASDEVRTRVARDLADGRRNDVTGTPALFVDGVRYDGAWDFHSMLEAIDRPMAVRVHRSARVFASLPTSAGLVLFAAAALAVLCANTPVAPLYERLMAADVGIGPPGRQLSLPVREWFSEGLLTIFFLLVGLEIRRELTKGALAERRAALLPILGAVGGVIVPSLIYLALNPGPTARGWAIPTATDIAFTLGLLAVLGDRVPVGLRAFVAALAVVDDVLSVVTIAIFYPRSFVPVYGLGVAAALFVLVAFNRARVYAVWPYLVVTFALWVALHALGVHAALAGVLLAMCLPTRPAPLGGPLLAQAATALAALEDAENEARLGGRPEAEVQREPVWEWAARNLAAATARFASPAERIERALAPWSAYLILPAFAFSATGVRVAGNVGSPAAARIFAGIVLGLVVGKPVGILLAAALAIAAGIAKGPDGVTARQFIGAACLCGIGVTVALLVTERAFGGGEAAVAKLAVLAGSCVAGVVGTVVLRWRSVPATPVMPRERVRKLRLFPAASARNRVWVGR